MHSMIVGLYHRVELYSCFEVSQLCLSIRSCFYFVLSNESLLRTKMFGVFFWHSRKQLCYQDHIFVCFVYFFNIVDSNRILLYFPLSVRVSVRAFVTGVTSHISHIYKGINAMLIIRGPIKP